MLFHVPDGASGTLARSVAASVGVADGDPDTNADAVSAGLAAGEDDGEPLAVAPTQPAATNAASATSALHLRAPRLLPSLDSTVCPPEDHPMRERVCDAMVEDRVMGPPSRLAIQSLTGSDVSPRASSGTSSP
jgi:hypothetical protein